MHESVPVGVRGRDKGVKRERWVVETGWRGCSQLASLFSTMLDILFVGGRASDKYTVKSKLFVAVYNERGRVSLCGDFRPPPFESRPGYEMRAKRGYTT